MEGLVFLFLECLKGFASGKQFPHPLIRLVVWCDGLSGNLNS